MSILERTWFLWCTPWAPCPWRFTLHGAALLSPGFLGRAWSVGHWTIGWKERKTMDYQYEAINVGGTAWMVKRRKEDGTWDEALLQSESTDPQEVIQQAIARGSWA